MKDNAPEAEITYLKLNIKFLAASYIYINPNINK